MTKKDYILIAKTIEAHVIASKGDIRAVLGQFASHLSQELKEDNRAFDKNRFLKACGFGEEGEVKQDFVERIAAEKPTNHLRWNDGVLEQLWDIQVTRAYTEDAAAGYRPTYHVKKEWRYVPIVFNSNSTE